MAEQPTGEYLETGPHSPQPSESGDPAAPKTPTTVETNAPDPMSTVSAEPAATGAFAERLEALAAGPIEAGADRTTGEPRGAAGGPGPASRAVHGYEVLGELGRGGMGVVYRARHIALNREVALKMVLGSARVERKELIRFLAEAEAVAAVRHPNVVQVYDYGEADGRPFMALEYLPGGTLAGRMEAVSRSKPAVVARLVEGVTRGVAAAHELGIVHRDLKPGNILLDASGEPKVTDFGLAKKVGREELTQAGAVMGTPAYMAPEQAGGNTKFVGPTADVWALGVLLHECLAGERPFVADTTPQLLARIQTADPGPLRGVAEPVPHDLALIARKCLEKSPADRYPTAKELADDLGRFVRGETISIRPAGLLERGYKWAKRKPTVAGLYAAVTLALVLLLAAAAVAVKNAEIASARDEAERERANAVTARGEAERERANAVAARDGEVAARAELTTLYYYRQVERAQAAWYNNDVMRSLRLLIDTAPDRRDWEWRYVAGLCGSEVRRTRVGGYLTGVGISPDEKTWVGAASDGTVTVWDGATGGERLVYRGHKRAVRRALFLPDGARVVSAGYDGEVHVWEAATGKTLHALKLPGEECHSHALSADGSRVAAGSSTGRVRVWDLESKEEIATLTGHRGMVFGLLFTPDGRLLSVGRDGNTGTLREWDVTAKKQVGEARNHRSPAWSLALSPDKKQLLTGDDAGRLYVWDAATLDPVSEFVAHDSRIWSITYSPDGSRVMTASLDQTAKVWDAKTLQLLRTIRGHTNDVMGGAFLPGGRLLTYGDRTARVWDATRDGEARALSAGGSVEGVAFDPSSRLVAGGTWNGIPVWEAGTGKLVGRFGAPGETGRAVAFTPDGTSVVSAGVSGKVRAWPLAGGASRVLGEHNAPITAFAFVPKSSRVASVGRDGQVKMWGSDPGKPVWSAPHAGVWAVAVSPDGGTLATCGEDKLIRLWDAGTGQPIRVLTGHTFRVFTVMFSPDGRRLASGSHDNTTRVWDVESGKEGLSIKGHVHYIDAVAFSPDGKRLVDASGDKTVKLYDSRTGQETLTLKGHGDWVTGAAFSPDGSYIATSARDGTVRVWEAPNGIEVALPPEANESHSGD